MVSIVVPVYNMEKFLPRCMDTLVSQSSDYEIILVDDGSTDRSPELCDDYRQRYPSLVRVEGAANPFNGTLISRELVSDIGYPKKEFFIKGDEVDYKQRALDAGAYVGTVTEAKYIHPRPETVEKTVLGVKVPFFVEAPWKEYYAARNFTYMYKLQEWYKGILFELIFVKLLAVISLKCKKMETIKMLFKGVYDGWKGNLGVKVKP